jgi:hypothetical protein
MRWRQGGQAQAFRIGEQVAVRRCRRFAQCLPVADTAAGFVSCRPFLRRLRSRSPVDWPWTVASLSETETRRSRDYRRLRCWPTNEL